MRVTPYTYSVLQYRHDAWSGEAMNVGLIFVCKSLNFVKFKANYRSKRLFNFFPNLDRTSFRKDLQGLERTVGKLNESWMLLMERSSARELGDNILPFDDSSFVWHLDGSGVTKSPEDAFNDLFDRFVSQYETYTYRDPRSDAQVFECIKPKLAAMSILDQMQEHTVTSDISSVTFDHSFKNGHWHCIQPLSFDSADSDQLQRKAERWAGVMLGLAEASDEFQPYLLTGMPSKEALNSTYQDMLELLRRSPNQPVVVDEADSDEIIDRIVGAMRVR